MKITERIKVSVISALLVVGLSACDKPGPAETAGKKIDQAAGKAGDKMNETGDKLGNKLEQAGDAMDDAAAKAKKESK